MPTYEYECRKCGVYDVFQSMNDKALTKCPKCKGKVKRLLGSGSGIIFKGSGFYETDYKKRSTPPSESKPEVKAETAKKETASPVKDAK